MTENLLGVWSNVLCLVSQSHSLFPFPLEVVELLGNEQSLTPKFRYLQHRSFSLIRDKREERYYGLDHVEVVFLRTDFHTSLRSYAIGL